MRILNPDEMNLRHAILATLDQGPDLRIEVEGEPKGEPRPSPSRRGSRMRVHPGHQADDWKRTVRLAALAELGLERAPEEPVYDLRTPLLVVVELRQSEKRAIEAPVWFLGKPDVDNELKAVLDALGRWPTGARPLLWQDDQSVVAVLAWKSYPIGPVTPGATVEVYRLPA